MRFISKSQEYNRTVRQPEISLVQGPRGPEEKVTRDAIMAQFTQGGATAYEKELALSKFKFGGSYEGEDVSRRLSIYDTDFEAEHNGWDADTKAEIERNLLEGQNEYYFHIPEIKVPTPWPTYDTQTLKQIVETVKATGASVEHVVAYERENKNREALISELEALSAESEPLIAA